MTASRRHRLAIAIRVLVCLAVVHVIDAMTGFNLGLWQRLIAVALVSAYGAVAQLCDDWEDKP